MFSSRAMVPPKVIVTTPPEERGAGAGSAAFCPEEAAPGTEAAVCPASVLSPVAADESPAGSPPRESTFRLREERSAGRPEERRSST